VLTNADERIEKTRNDTARLVKSDLNFHLFFQTLLSLLQKIRNLSKIALFSLKRHHPLHPSASSCSAKKKIEAKQPKKKNHLQIKSPEV